MIYLSLTFQYPRGLALQKNLLPKLSEAVRATAFRIQRDAVANLTASVYSHSRKPTPTGALRASIYVLTHRDQGGYAKAASKVRSRLAMGNSTPGMRKTPDIGAAIAEEVAAPDRPDEAIVAVAASYGVYVEKGARGSAGVHYLFRAWYKNRVYFRERCQRALSEAMGA